MTARVNEAAQNLSLFRCDTCSFRFSRLNAES